MNKEIKRLEWWIDRGDMGDSVEMISADEAFANFSERGKEPDFSRISNPLRYHELQLAKMREGQHVSMYEEGVLDGSVPYFTLLGGENPHEIPPREIVLWMSGQLFSGRDKEIIEKLYKEIIAYWSPWRRLVFNLQKWLKYAKIDP